MSKLALFGGKKAIEKEFAPYISLGEKEKKIVLEVLDLVQYLVYGSKGKYFLGGKYVRKFEEKYVNYGVVNLLSQLTQILVD